MHPPALRPEAASSPPSVLSSPTHKALIGVHEPLPAAVETALWRGDQLGSAVSEGMSTGFADLDALLPGRGWPCGVLTEILVSQFSVVEFRLLSPVLNALTQAKRTVVLVGPSMVPTRWIWSARTRRSQAGSVAISAG